ncbi:penicillin-binding protein 1C [Arcticibacter sp. MXS-1]|uniref:penicillin-binding protein 1C n=1 Tax=Arcticibacter sp. MXS-1 TaxID=3341726 RepID=UPI0035A903C9
MPLPQIAPHLLDLAKKDFRKGNSRETRIRTSIRMDLQERVNTVLLNHQGRLAANGVNNMAALVLDVHTGKAVAYIGNIYQPKNTEIESHVDIIQARRSPGSTLKPLLYAAMLNEGYILPNTLVPDIPTQIAGYQPNNYDLGYDGAVPASKALARSLNVPAVRMLQQYKYSRFYSMLKSCGISTLNKPADFYGLSLILGGCEVSMWELAGVYASMARRLEAEGDLPEWSLPGYHLETAAPTGGSGEVSYDMGRAATWYTFEAMNEVMRPGEEQLWQRFESSQRIAWKTGTSFGFRDAWALGLTPDHVVVVWAGNADGEGRPGLTGIDAAAPIMFDIFRLLPAARRWFRKPQKEMVRVRVCSESGMRAVKGCAHQAETWLPSSALKAPVCPYNRLVHLDKTGKWQVTDRCMAPSDMIHRYWFVLPPAMEYYYKTKNYGYKPLPLFLPGCDEREQSEKSAMELIYPRNNAEVYIPVEIGGSRGQMIFTAAHSQEGEPIFWHLDHRYIGKTEGPHQMAFSPSPGLHTITLVDRDGNRLEQTFRVLDKERN